MKKISYLFSIILLIQGLVLLTGNSIYSARMTLEPNLENILFSFTFSLFCAILPKFIKEAKYTKCPKCKDSFAYSDLNNEICPKCNIKTIDIEKYYNKNNVDK